MALVKILLLSQRLCTQHLQLLFTLVEKSSNPLVRSQLIIGIGDLVYRFPNALEPWTSHLYLPLRDTKSTVVRMNTIRVLSHLILKEMIKTRGQIYEIALCTIDADEKIAALSKAFFQELSQRNNGLVIYNAMPDIISQLSGSESNESGEAPRFVSEDSFRTIVTYLFGFIKRDKQCETLIEKLCHAFRQANSSERKCRDLAFCLSKIQLSENGIKKLKETFRWYADKLSIQAVYETFKNNILKNARKLPTLKNETKMLIDELEKQIEDIRQKGLGDDQLPPASQATGDQSESGNDSNSDSSPNPSRTQKSKASKANAKATQKKSTKPAATRAAAAANTTKSNLRKRKTIVSSSSSSNSESAESTAAAAVNRLQSQ